MDGDGERREEGGREGVEGGRHKLRINFTFFCSHSYALFFGFQYMYMYFCFLFHSQQYFLPVTFLSLVNVRGEKAMRLLAENAIYQRNDFCNVWPQLQLIEEKGRAQRRIEGGDVHLAPPWRIQGGATPPPEISKGKNVPNWGKMFQI